MKETISITARRGVHKTSSEQGRILDFFAEGGGGLAENWAACLNATMDLNFVLIPVSSNTSLMAASCSSSPKPKTYHNGSCRRKHINGPFLPAPEFLTGSAILPCSGIR